MNLFLYCSVLNGFSEYKLMCETNYVDFFFSYIDFVNSFRLPCVFIKATFHMEGYVLLEQVSQFTLS